MGDLATIPVEMTEAGSLVMRIVLALEPVTSDTIAAAGYFEDKPLLSQGTIFALAADGFVTRTKIGHGAHDVYVVRLTPDVRAALRDMQEDFSWRNT
jgi:hypothetical protein